MQQKMNEKYTWQYLIVDLLYSSVYDYKVYSNKI